jgi:predicted GNAT family acetyltransferase
VDDQLCVLDYSRSAGKMVIYHTEVPRQIEGRGWAACMTRAALDFARAEHLQVVPQCSYAAAFFQKNPQYADLLAT